MAYHLAMFNPNLEDADDHDPYLDLGNAIIARAYKDYIFLAFVSYDHIVTENGKIVRTIHRSGALDPQVNKDEIIEFLHSHLYDIITDIPGDLMLELAKKEIDLLEESYEKGLIWSQFNTIYNNRLFCVNKHDYGYLAKERRKQKGLVKRIAKFEQLAAPYENVYHKECQVYKVVDINTYNLGNDDDIYIDSANMYFYKHDKATDKFYLIFNGKIVNFLHKGGSDDGR